jgi:hypothetical protein
VKRNRWTKGHKPRQHISLLERINPDVAGIDCGSAEHFVAVPVGRDPDPVQSFMTFTADLHRLADWLAACGVRSVAMEATGVYWIPLFDILEARGFEVIVTNAHHVKNVAGRKSDVVDCEWLRELHSVGLLRGSFRPIALAGLLISIEPLIDMGRTAVNVSGAMTAGVVTSRILGETEAAPAPGSGAPRSAARLRTWLAGDRGGAIGKRIDPRIRRFPETGSQQSGFGVRAGPERITEDAEGPGKGGG